MACLGAIVIALGPLSGRVPITLLQLVIGVLLLLFGLSSLRKVILRAAGIVPLHDKKAIFDKDRAALTRDTQGAPSQDWITAFKAVLLEGLEVMFIVVAVGARARDAMAREPWCVGRLCAGAGGEVNLASATVAGAKECGEIRGGSEAFGLWRVLDGRKVAGRLAGGDAIRLVCVALFLGFGLAAARM